MCARSWPRLAWTRPTDRVTCRRRAVGVRRSEAGLEQAPHHETDAAGDSSIVERRVSTGLAVLCLALILAQGSVLLDTFHGLMLYESSLMQCLAAAAVWLTDGKVAPFLATSDMRSFLLRHRPDYWVANDAVFYRPYLANGILRRVVEAIGSREGASLASDGIVFTNIHVNRAGRVPGFAGYRQLFALSYPPDSAATSEGSR